MKNMIPAAEDLLFGIYNTQQNEYYRLCERNSGKGTIKAFDVSFSDEMPYEVRFHNKNTFSYYAVALFCDGMLTKDTRYTRDKFILSPDKNAVYLVEPNTHYAIKGFYIDDERVREFVVSKSLRQSAAREEGILGSEGLIEVLLYPIDFTFSQNDKVTLLKLHKELKEAEKEEERPTPIGTQFMSVTTYGRDMFSERLRLGKKIGDTYSAMCADAYDKGAYQLDEKKCTALQIHMHVE